MKISDYSVQSSSSHYLEQNHVVTEQLQVFTATDGSTVEVSGQQDDEQAYILDFSNNDASEMGIKDPYFAVSSESKGYLDSEAWAKLRLIESFIFQTTGRKVQLKDPMSEMESEPVRGILVPGPTEFQDSDFEGWAITYDYREIFEEIEQIDFRFSGAIKTEDGKEFAFNLDFNMTREYYEESGISIRMGDAARVDPLVVVYNDGLPSLSDEKQAFDLDADGMTEMISMPESGSGFLALDKNANGLIDDGSELFGPQSGNGFDDLRVYDEDGNGWIDESDDVFGKLSIMTVDAEGNQTIFKLGDVGIGAIYLNEIDTPFKISENVGEKGVMQSSSVYLREDGTAGSIHHIDLTL